MAFNLHVVPSYGAPFAHILSGDELVIGRSSGSDLVIEDEVVSRTHAKLFREGRAWFLEDMKSHNGTWLNGKKVDRPMVIGLGDVIRLSGTVITVRNVLISGEEDSFPSIARGQTSDLFRKASDMLASQEEVSASLDSQDSLEQLRGQAARFRVLNEFHRALARPISKQDLLQLILERSFELLNPEEGVIFLFDPETGDLYPAASRTEPGMGGGEFLCSRSLMDQVAGKGMAALIQDAQTDERFAAAESILSAGIRSLVSAPLLDSEGILGMIVLHSRLTARKFSEEDMTLLVSIASAAAMRLRNMTLAENAAKRLMDSNRHLEMKVAERTRELEKTNEEILRTRDQLIMQEKMASLGTLTAGVAHEIRNPLNFINNFSEISIELLTEIKEELERIEQWTPENRESVLGSMNELIENAAYITEHGERANRIVQSMMELAVDGTGKYQDADVNALVNEYVSLAYKGFKAKDNTINIQIIEEYDEEVGRNTVASQNLGRVLINLVNNAVEAVLERQEKEGESFKPQVWIRTHNLDQKEMEITIEDNGSGIVEEHQDRLFTPFFTTKPTGDGNIGLGLTISYDIIVNEHSGRLEVVSQPGRNTIARVVLPILPPLERDTLDRDTRDGDTLPDGVSA